MNLRPLGNTGMKVSAVGLGAWQLANPRMGRDDTAEAVRIIQASLARRLQFLRHRAALWRRGERGAAGARAEGRPQGCGDLHQIRPQRGGGDELRHQRHPPLA